MEFTDYTQEIAWKNTVDRNKGFYNAASLRFAARWAELMEAELEKGAELVDIMDTCENLADTEGITGYQAHWGKLTLYNLWKYGKDLREATKLKEERIQAHLASLK